MGPELRQAWEQLGGDLLMPDGRWDRLPPRTLLEIGSGMGEAILAAAPSFDLAIGVDVHVRGLAATMRAVRAAGVGNVRLMRGDVIDVLRDQVPLGSLAEIHIWFPDPWPKARHHKRRLIRPEVTELLASALMSGGVLRLATDIAEYAQAMVEVLRTCPSLRPSGAEAAGGRPTWRPVTRYEQFGLDRGRTPTELAYCRV